MSSTGQVTTKKAAESAQRAREFATAWEAYDACAAINPSNPLAVAEKIEYAFALLRSYARGNDLYNLERLNSETKDFLARIEGKAQ